MANIVYIATSIDGFIARKDGNVDWLMETPNPEGGDFGFSDLWWTGWGYRRVFLVHHF